MLFGILGLIAIDILLTVATLGGARRNHADLQGLKSQVKLMTEAQDAVAQDIAAIKTGIANWNAAAAANLDAKLAAAKAAWEADDETKWNTTHAELQELSKSFATNAPVTPLATQINPNPTPVASPAAGTTASPAA